MSRLTEPNQVYNIRQYVEQKRHNTLWKDVDGQKYVEDVEYLLEYVTELVDERDEFEDKLEDRYQEGWDSGYDDGYQEGYDEGIDEGSRNAVGTMKRLLDDI